MLLCAKVLIIHVYENLALFLPPSMVQGLQSEKAYSLFCLAYPERSIHLGCSLQIPSSPSVLGCFYCSGSHIIIIWKLNLWVA